MAKTPKIPTLTPAEFNQYTSADQAAVRLEEMTTERWKRLENTGIAAVLGSAVIAAIVAFSGTCYSSNRAAKAALEVEQERSRIATELEQTRSNSAAATELARTHSAYIVKGLDAANLTASASYLAWLRSQALIPTP